MSDIVDNFDISWSSIEEGEFLLSQENDDVDIEDHLYAALLKYQQNEVVTEPNKRFKAQDLENCKKGRTPLFNYNPNSDHFLTYDQPSVVMKGKKLVSFETSILPSNQKNSVHFDAAKIVSRIKNPTYLEKNLKEVRETLNQGCFCNMKNCFSNLDPEDVFEHRANMSKLSITDRNMFLMGALMTCMLQNESNRRRTIIKYAYKGKRVCGDAFLYLQFCTFQQLNRVRDWLVHNGVGSFQYPEQDCTTVLFRAMHRPIKEFIIEFIKVNVGDVDIDSKEPVIMPVGVTKKSLHEEYQAYILKSFPGRKLLGYNSFSKFLLQYFPQLMFRNVGGVIKINNQRPANKVLNSIQNSNVKAVEVEKIQAVSPFLVIPPPTRYTNVCNSGGQIAHSNALWNSSSASSFSISSDLEI